MTDFDPYSQKIADICALIRQYGKCEAWELFKNSERGLEVLCSIVDAVRAEAKAAVPVIDQAQLFAIANGLIAEVDKGEEDDDDKSNTVRGIAWMHSEVLKAFAAPRTDQATGAEMSDKSKFDAYSAQIAHDDLYAQAAKTRQAQLEKDAARYRFRKQFLAENGAILFSTRGCQLRKYGFLIGEGKTEEEALDAAMAATQPSKKE